MQTYRNTGIDSAVASQAVTPSDTNDVIFDALYVGGAGNVVIKHIADGATTTFAAVPAGSILPVRGVRVMAATTATNIVAMRL